MHNFAFPFCVPYSAFIVHPFPIVSIPFLLVLVCF